PVLVGADPGDLLRAGDRGHRGEAGDAVLDQQAALDQRAEARRAALVDRPAQHVAAQGIDVGEDQLLAAIAGHRWLKSLTTADLGPSSTRYRRTRRPACLRWARWWRLHPSQTRPMTIRMIGQEKKTAIARTTIAQRATMKPSAPPPEPSRLEAPKTRSEITTQPTIAPTPPSTAPSTLSTMKPITRATITASRTMRPRAPPWVPVVPASMPIATPTPRSVRICTVEKPNGVGTRAHIRHTSR